MDGNELRAMMHSITEAPTYIAESTATAKLLRHVDELAAALDDRDRLECVLAIGRPCFLHQPDGMIALANDGFGELTILGKGTTIRAAIDDARGVK